MYKVKEVKIVLILLWGFFRRDFTKITVNNMNSLPNFLNSVLDNGLCENLASFCYVTSVGKTYANYSISFDITTLEFSGTLFS